MSQDMGLDHNPVARYCIVVDVGIPLDELRDDVTCDACDALSALLDLDPDYGSAEDGRPYIAPGSEATP